jgi:hypothetical protein
MSVQRKRGRAGWETRVALKAITGQKTAHEMAQWNPPRGLARGVHLLHDRADTGLLVG